MRIAIFLGNENFIDESMIQAYAFNVQNGVITSIGDELLSVKNVKYLLSWLLAQKINIVYMNCRKEEVKRCFKRIDVETKPLGEIKNNPLLEKFLVYDK